MDLKGADDGPLKGKRIAIKDNIFIAGTPLSNGSKIWEGYTPEVDATVVTRILDAGKLPLTLKASILSRPDFFGLYLPTIIPRYMGTRCISSV